MKPLLISAFALYALTACSTAEVDNKRVLEQSEKKPEAVQAGPAADAAKKAEAQAGAAKPVDEKATPAADAVTLAPKEKSGSVDAKSEAQIILKTADGKTVAAPAAKSEIANKDDHGGATAGGAAAGGAAAEGEKAQTSAASAISKGEDGVAPAVALAWLKNGNKRFVKHYLRNDGASMTDVKRLSTGQKPHTIVLSCSDSRVPPEIVFDQKLGEIFVVRTAGESLDAMALASIEYAYEHLGARHLVVLGHTMCGAVKAAYGTLKGGDAGSPWLNQLVADIHPRIRAIAEDKPSNDFINEGWANVKGVARDLPQRSNILREAIESGKLGVSQGLYHLDNGEVEWQ